MSFPFALFLCTLILAACFLAGMFYDDDYDQ